MHKKIIAILLIATAPLCISCSRTAGTATQTEKSQTTENVTGTEKVSQNEISAENAMDETTEPVTTTTKSIDGENTDSKLAEEAIAVLIDGAPYTLYNYVHYCAEYMEDGMWAEYYKNLTAYEDYQELLVNYYMDIDVGSPEYIPVQTENGQENVYVEDAFFEIMLSMDDTFMKLTDEEKKTVADRAVANRQYIIDNHLELSVVPEEETWSPFFENIIEAHLLGDNLWYDYIAENYMDVLKEYDGFTYFEDEEYQFKLEQ